MFFLQRRRQSLKTELRQATSASRTPPWLPSDGDVGVGVFPETKEARIGGSELVAGQPQKFSTIQTVLSTVGAGMATYFPLCEGMAQAGIMLFTCQSWCALPAKSTYNKVDLHPVGLLVTKSPLES